MYIPSTIDKIYHHKNIEIKIEINWYRGSPQNNFPCSYEATFFIPSISFYQTVNLKIHDRQQFEKAEKISKKIGLKLINILTQKEA
jgi:hypothetical protein